MNFDERLAWEVKNAEDILTSYLPEKTGFQKTVLEAINYSVKAGGKRLRPILMKLSYTLYGGSAEIIKPFMAALEMIHNYSLVHDDLEAMDNDEYRRGMKTTHVVYGEAMAILAGDGLLNLAFETACKAFEIEPGNKNAERALMILGRKAGIFGMVGGQVVDVEAEKANKELSMDQLTYIHANKTAALIQAALMIGAVLAGANDEEVSRMEKVGYNVGLAFQIQDDILDVTSTFQELGKPIGSDTKNEKLTYVSYAGLEESKKQVEMFSKEAISLLKSAPGEHAFMEELIESLIYRKK